MGCCASKGWLGNLVEGEVAARIFVGCGRSFGEYDLRLRLDLLVIEFWELMMSLNFSIWFGFFDYWSWEGSLFEFLIRQCRSESSCASESVEDLTCRMGFEIPLLRGISLTHP
ncbi:hypothetical protein Droror1_Dr00011616 [Drosera rotundifolia]